MDYNYSAVIGLYNGHEWLDKLIDALRFQVVMPKKIIVWINHNNTKAFDFEKYAFHKPCIKFIQASTNDGVYDRFAAGLLCNTDRVMILDDDTIPGKCWSFNCLETIKKVGEESIIGYRGIRLLPDALYDIEAYQKGTNDITEVDLCGHSWFVKRKHILAMFEDQPVNKFNGEDTHISAINQIKYGTKTYIPAQPLTKPQYHGSTMQHLGALPGRLSTSLGPQRHLSDRKIVNEYWINIRNWKPLFMRYNNETLPKM
jgi:hypothetical protein